MNIKKNILWLFILMVSISVCVFLGVSYFVKKKENTKTIFVTNPAIGSLVKSIVGNELNVQILGSYSENFHSHDITPDAIEQLQNAKMLIFVSTYDESFVNVIIRNIPTLKTFEIFGNEIFLKNIYSTYYNYLEYSDFLKHKENIDPHFWLSPLATKYAVEALYTVIIAMFPEKNDIFKNNYEHLKTELELLLNLGISKLEPCGNNKIFALHDAFFYVHKDFKLNYLGGITENLENGFKPDKIIKLTELQYTQAICMIFNQTNSVVIEKIRKAFPYVNYIEIDSDGLNVNYNSGINGYKQFITNNIDLFANCTCK